MTTATNGFLIKLTIEPRNLNIGDFVIGRYIIERKTLSDLASSILDGRYKEQSSRLDTYIQEHIEEQQKFAKRFYSWEKKGKEWEAFLKGALHERQPTGL